MSCWCWVSQHSASGMVHTAKRFHIDYEVRTAALTEMATLGATYLTGCNEPPSSIIDNTYGQEEIFVAASLTLYFSPHPEYEIYDFKEYESSGPSTDRYIYTYSEMKDGSFAEIPATVDIDSALSPFEQYSSRVYLQQSDGGLAVSGNHYASTYASGLNAIPLRATHAELWFYENADSERELVRRVPLQSLHNWVEYIKPIVDGAPL